MKLTKMSLTTLLLLGANLSAIDNIKVNGSASIFYGTAAVNTKNGSNPDMFNKDASYVDTGLALGTTADLTQGVSAGAILQTVSTLGLENNLASGVWSGAHEKTGNQISDAYFFSEAWLKASVGKTTLKVGRQPLETPLIFTETWDITTNTFEAAVVKNKDIPDTTLIGAWIGASNGTGDDNLSSNIGSVTSVNGEFNTFGTNGAFLVGLVNNSFKPLTVQAWYYNMQSFANAYWLQADLDTNGILAGIQYVNMDPAAANSKDDSAYAGMLGYVMKDIATFKIAYSSVDKEGTYGVSNIATRGQSAGAASSLYTEMWWWYGTVSQTGADTITLSAETTLLDIDFFLGYYSCDIAPKGMVVGTQNSVDEVAFTASKSFGPLDSSIALIYDSFGYKGGTTSGDMQNSTTFQLYLTYNF